MHFSIEPSIEILERTPAMLNAWLRGLSNEWVLSNEGAETWSPYDVVGHLIYCEKADWMLRAEIILSAHPDKTFEPFNRFAHFEESKGKTLVQLLDEFAERRHQNIEKLRAKQLTDQDLAKTGIHPAFGEVRLSQLLAAWVVHDLGHISQIARVMAKQYTTETGPWIAYLRILQS